MKKNLLFGLLCMLGCQAFAQNGALTINNNTPCTVTIQMYADDHGTFVGTPFNIASGNFANFSDPCNFESAIGWMTSSLCVGGPGYSSTFSWQNVRVFFVDCDQCGLGPYVGSRWNGPGSYHGGLPHGYPTWSDGCRRIDWASSGTAPEDVTIDIN